MAEFPNGHSKEEVHQKLDVEGDKEVVTEDGMKAQAYDETLGMGSAVADESIEETVIENWVGNGKEKGQVSSSSSSDDEEAKIAVIDTDRMDENGVSDLTVEEEAVIESRSVTEDLKVEEVIGEHISEVVDDTADEAKGSVEGEREVVITEDSQTVEAVLVEQAEVESDQVESAVEVLSAVVEHRDAEYADQEGSNGTLQFKEEDSFPAVDISHKAELAETKGNPQMLSISARTTQPTSWRGCCGLLEVFKRGDR